MTTPVSNKIIAITGAASGIGLTMAHLLASRGASLSLADLNASTLTTLASEFQTKYPSLNIITAAIDVRDVPAVDAWIAQTISHFGRLDDAVNLAGVIGKSLGNPETGGIKDLESEEWEFVIGINLREVFNCMRAELKVLADGGSVVSASSVAGICGRAFNGSYTAAKHGVMGLTRSAAREVGERGIRVNCICPGFIHTPMTIQSSKQNAAVGNPDHQKNELASNVPLNRPEQADEVASLIAFLLGDESKFVSGAAYTIDGGMTC